MLSSQEIQQLIDVGASAEQILVMTRIVEERMQAEKLRKQKQRDRKRAYRESLKDKSTSVPGQSGDNDGTVVGHDGDKSPSLSSFPLVPPLPLASPSPPIIPQTPLPTPVSANSRKKNKPEISLDELSVDHIKDWLAKKRAEGKYLRHNEHEVLEVFKDYCRSKGAKYENYVAAYRNAFSWDRFEKNGKPVNRPKDQRETIYM